MKLERLEKGELIEKGDCYFDGDPVIPTVIGQPAVYHPGDQKEFGHYRPVKGYPHMDQPTKKVILDGLRTLADWMEDNL